MLRLKRMTTDNLGKWNKFDLLNNLAKEDFCKKKQIHITPVGYLLEQYDTVFLQAEVAW